MLLQPLCWRCTECAVQHERNVRRETPHNLFPHCFMRQNRQYLFDMSNLELEVFGVFAAVRVHVSKFFGVGTDAGVLKPDVEAELEFEKCDTADLGSTLLHLEKQIGLARKCRILRAYRIKFEVLVDKDVKKTNAD